MKLTQDNHSTSDQLISYYDHEKMIIDNAEYRQNCVIFPDDVPSIWPHSSVDELSGDDFEAIIAKQPELILLGTGKQLVFPAADTLAYVQMQNIGFEVMDIGAACRSYNLLRTEQRYIAAIMMFCNG